MMADFTFYGSWKDTSEILQQILGIGGCKLIANIAYKKPECLEIRSLSEYNVKKIRKNCSIYIWSDLYSKYPIKFYPPNKQGYMGIELQLSGPLIQMGLADIFEEDGMFRIGQGSIHYPPYFINPKTKRAYSPPPSIYKAFLPLKRIIQKSLVKQYWQFENIYSKGGTRLTTEPIWIGKDALNLMRSEVYFIDKRTTKLTRNQLKASRE